MSNVPYSNPEIYLNGFDLSPYFLRKVGFKYVFGRVPRIVQSYFFDQRVYSLFLNNCPYWFNFIREQKFGHFSRRIQLGVIADIYFINCDDDYATFLFKFAGEIVR